MKNLAGMLSFAYLLGFRSYFIGGRGLNLLRSDGEGEEAPRDNRVFEEIDFFGFIKFDELTGVEVKELVGVVLLELQSDVKGEEGVVQVELVVIGLCM